jgi:hypothetical protein
MAESLNLKMDESLNFKMEQITRWRYFKYGGIFKDGGIF